MYLSRIELDVKKRDTMRALNWPVVMHGAIESSFQDKGERKLWRVDYLKDRCYLLVLSETLPDFTRLAEQFSAPGTKSEHRNYQPLLDRVQNGQKYRFRLCANPVHCTKRDVGLSSKTDRGVIKAHVTQDQQCQWLIDKAPNCGFSLDIGEKVMKSNKQGEQSEAWTHPGFDIVHTTWRTFGKRLDDKSQKNKVTLRTATYEGTLTVTDANLFRQKLIGGIGREKAYGCGLLTIIPVRD
ncbi:MAG: type I-E CRISPR-associated protein Cas6/Cse3/CasE [Proteobacteria bacterium]|nr:type I-E CRISPR-associated protein Cas6/Cse3/CasE [Pseudomonadota bacterium]